MDQSIVWEMLFNNERKYVIERGVNIRIVDEDELPESGWDIIKRPEDFDKLFGKIENLILNFCDGIED